MNIITSYKRIEYIDALRGFTMILVVLHHITQPSQTFINELFITFRMPLFFFVSGYIAYKATEKWDLRSVINKIIKKIKIQLIPTAFFGILFTYTVHNSNLVSWINDPYKFGYWFTLVLLELFIIYYVYNLIISRLNPKWGGVIFYAFTVPLCGINAIDNIHNYKIISVLCLAHLFMYLQFFAFGTLVRRYQKVADKLLDNKYMILIIFLLFFIIYTIIRNSTPTTVITDKIIDLLNVGIRYLGLIIVFATFRKYQNTFSTATKMGNMLQYIGKHTLDIYLLHYFFIPDISPFRGFIFSGNNYVFELFFGIGFSLMVIAICLIISNIIKTSDLLAHYLFGAKIEKTEK